MDPDRRLVAGRYRLLSPLGTGGMGTVWRAEDSVLGRFVAVKEVTFPHGLSDEDRDVLRERTRREARAAARLDHPSAVTVYDVVEEDGAPYLVMELVEARTLSQVVRADGPLTPQQTARIGLCLLGALEAAHARGIVHRDVKPGNVLIAELDGPLERVVLTDFGIASSVGDSSITSTGLLLGSPSYIAPERARGQSPAPASDLWSLGATLFTAVEGKPPFDGGNPMLTVTAVVTGEHAPFERAGPLEKVLEGLLERDPAQRMTVPAAQRELERIVVRSTVDSAPTLAVPLPELSDEPVPAKPDAERTAALPLRDLQHAVEEPRQPWTRPPRVPTRDARSSRTGLVALVLGLLLAVGVVTLVLVTDPGRSGLRALTPGGDDPGPSAGPSPEPAALPEGWTRYVDEAEGWSIGVPPGYVQSTRGEQVQFRHPEQRRTLRINHRPEPQGSALQMWQAFSPQLDAELSQYQQLRLEKAEFRGLDAADLEFTYFDETDLRVLDRIVVTEDGEDAYALYWQVRASDWEPALPAFEQMAATFDPSA